MDGRCKDKVKYDKCDEYWSSLYRSRLDNIQYRYGKNITRYGIRYECINANLVWLQWFLLGNNIIKKSF